MGNKKQRPKKTGAESIEEMIDAAGRLATILDMEGVGDDQTLRLVQGAVFGSPDSALGSSTHLANVVKRLFEVHLRKGGIDDQGAYWFRTKASRPFGPSFGERELEKLGEAEILCEGSPTPLLEAMQQALRYGANRGKRDYRRATAYLDAIKAYLR